MDTLNTLARVDAAVAAYLAHYRALGRGYDQEEWVLGLMRTFLAQQRVADLDRQCFEQWRSTFAHLHPNSRHTYERIVHSFCRYRRRSEAGCFLPNPASLVRPIPHALPIPIEPAQIARMLTLASSLLPTPISPLRPAVMRIALVLLYTSGLRLGELLRLTLDDADPKAGVLRIQESKFHKSRWVPLSSSACTELNQYLRIRQRSGADVRSSAPLLCNRRSRGWRPYSPNGLHQALHALFEVAGVRNGEGRCPRVHDIRHAFAVEALRRWYAREADVQVNLPKLALYMGHVSIASTAYYLRWMPAVMASASERFERHCGSLIGENPS
jgi:integrase/recombinase XerD